MRIRRGLLFWGLLLIPLGAVPLLVRTGVFDIERLGDVWRLWPVLLIAIGLTIVLTRSRASIIGTIVVALVLGTFAGAALAAGPVWVGQVTDCSLGSTDATGHLDRSGVFGSSASVEVDLRCGTVSLTSTNDGQWRLTSAHRGADPMVTATAGRLSVRTPNGQVHEEWLLGLPAGRTDRIELTANAGTADLRLAGLDVGTIDATVNAGDLRIDLAEGTLGRLDATVNAGRVRLVIGQGALDGSISANAGGIDLCVPDTVGLRLAVVDQITFSHNLAAHGLVRGSDGTWTRAAAPGGATASLRIEGNAASLTLDPTGGCR